MSYESAFHFVLSLSIKGALVLLLSFLIQWICRIQSASFKSSVWSTALLSLAIMPMLTGALPKWKIHHEIFENLSSRSSMAHSPVEYRKSVPELYVGNWISGEKAERLDSENGINESVETSIPVSTRTLLMKFALVFWVLGIGVCLFKIGRGHLRIRQWFRESTEIRAPLLQSHLGAIQTQLVLKKGAIRIRECPSFPIPFTSGLINPILFLPSGWNQWSSEKIRQVMTHELAHVKRKDCLWLTVAAVASTLNWFNPLVWLALRDLRRNQEKACDDVVLSTGANARSYASQLLKFASLSVKSPSFMPGFAMAHKTDLEARLESIVNPQQNRIMIPPKTTIFLYTGFLLLSGFIYGFNAGLDPTPVAQAQEAAAASLDANNKPTLSPPADSTQDPFAGMSKEMMKRYGLDPDQVVQPNPPNNANKPIVKVRSVPSRNPYAGMDEAMLKRYGLYDPNAPTTPNNPPKVLSMQDRVRGTVVTQVRVENLNLITFLKVLHSSLRESIPSGEPSINILFQAPDQTPGLSIAEWNIADKIMVHLEPTLYNVTLERALDAIIQSASHPISYTVVENGIIFSIVPESERRISFHTPERREYVILKLDENKKVMERIVNAFREEDQKIKSIRTYGYKGELQWEENLTYNEEDKLAEIQRMDPEGNLVIRTVFQFDDLGKHTGSQVMDAEGNTIPPEQWEKHR